jgi:hypothetical protein
VVRERRTRTNENARAAAIAFAFASPPFAHFNFYSLRKASVASLSVLALWARRARLGLERKKPPDPSRTVLTGRDARLTATDSPRFTDDTDARFGFETVSGIGSGRFSKTASGATVEHVEATVILDQRQDQHKKKEYSCD